ncbi:MAG: hypothetical protein IPI46_07375 [Bacteroidetes bacterium]|nr:hypothetical protein [Bacteroidota bacterium]
MKTTTIRMLGKGLTALCLMLWTHFAYAQPAVQLTYENLVQTSPTTFTFDLYAKNVGTTISTQLKGFQWGLNMTPMPGTFPFPGANDSLFYVPGSRDPIIPASATGYGTVLDPVYGYRMALGSPAGSPGLKPLSNSNPGFFHLRQTVSIPTGSEPLMVPNVAYKLGTYLVKVSNASLWSNAYNPFLPPTITNVAPVQVISVGGYTHSVVNILLDGAGSAMSLTQALGTLSTTMIPSSTGPSPFLLNNSCSNTTSSLTASACDSYTWADNGQTYTASGVYTHTTLIGSGPCTNTATLNLTINNSTSSSSSATACDSYSWNGTTYTASGTYSGTFTAANGCDSVHQLTLNIVNSTSNTTTASACDSYTWSVNSVTYTASGSWSVTTGCHTETLNLTITPTTSSTTTISACDSYTWSVNTVTYTASGSWSVTTGCHTETLNLTINNSTSASSSATACDTYTWSANGATCNFSGYMVVNECCRMFTY